MDTIHATILVLIVTNHNIVLAADSRKTYLYAEGTGDEESIEKIGHTNDYYFAVSGLHSVADGSFSIPSIINEVLLHTTNAGLAIKQIAEKLTAALKDYLSGLKKRSSDLFAQLKLYCSSGGEMVILKRVNNIPTAYLLDYQIIDGATLKVVLNTWSTDITKISDRESCFWRAIGNTSFLNTRMPAEKDMAINPVEKAQWLIEEGIRTNAHFVGKPIRILEMTTDGVKWVK